MEKTIFEVLNKINVNDRVEKKNKLTYLSWAWAWAEVKKAYPNANYKVYENEQGWNYFTDGRTGWVKTGLIIEGLEHIEYLPIMDNYNKSIPLDKITSFDVNKTIQRSLTKAAARHGLGLYIYAGEDLPEEETEPKQDVSDEEIEKKYDTYYKELLALGYDLAFDEKVSSFVAEKSGVDFNNNFDKLNKNQKLKVVVELGTLIQKLKTRKEKQNNE